MGICQLSVSQGLQATITGKVTDENSETVIGASIIVKNESTGFQTGSITNDKGEYLIKQLPLGSPYTIIVSYIGYGQQSKTGYSLNQGDVLKVNFKLSVSEIKMSEVEVVANSLKNKASVLGSATSISQKDIATLPVNGRNFTSLTDLSPLSSGSNLSGQLASATSYTIDGMTAKSPTSSGTTNRGPYLVSMEAIREFEVITNSYDVTQGRSGGGNISSVTKSGTNQIHGSAFVYHRADFLSSNYTAAGNKNKDEYSVTQFGLSLGGPIVKNRAHYFVALDQQLDSRPLLIADIQNKEDEKSYGISKENLDEFVDIARRDYGVANSQQVGSFTKKRPSTTLFARIDWQLDSRNLLTIRNNYNRDMNNLGISDNSSINLFEVYGNHLSTDNSLLATLRSVISPEKTNELKVQYLYTLDDGTPGDQLPYDNIPRAIIQNITSEIDGKDYTLSSIQFGGQRYEPEKFKNNVVQVVDNFYYNSDKVNYTLGGDIMYTNLYSLATSEMNGRFYYNGMDNFKNNTPYRYAREVAVGDPAIKQGVINAALYAQAQISLFNGADLTLGIRGDYTYYLTNPQKNDLLEKELSLSTTNKLKAFQFQPRAQFTWDIGNNNTDIIKIGGGIMGSNMNNYAMINNLLFDGNKVYSLDIRADLPNADFERFRKDPSSAPGIEIFDQLGIDKVATYNINSADIKMPVIYKYSLSYNKFFNDRMRAGVSFYGSNTINNYMYIDRNMVDVPFFTLDNEAGRGVFVPASSVSAKGNTDWTKGKKSNKIARVLELVSEGKVNSYSFVADMSYRYFKDGQISASYTWNDSKDNTSYNGNVANSATLYQMVVDDPRDLSNMSYSNTQFRHKLVIYGNTPSFWGINIGVRYSGMGGTRYSMVVNGNINGDYVSGNDLAYVFDPNDSKTPDNIREGIIGLLNNPDIEQGFKEYIKDSYGKVAERNGGINPFSGTFDIRITKDIKIVKSQKLQLSVDLFNVANMLNKERGLNKNLSKQSIFNVTGFDQVKKEFVYSVNPNAGKSTFKGNVWQIQIGGKYIF